MKCPECGAWSIIKETRDSPTFGYRRRRECANEHKFTTQEIIVPEEAIAEQRRQNALKAGASGRAKKLALQSRRWTLT